MTTKGWRSRYSRGLRDIRDGIKQVFEGNSSMLQFEGENFGQMSVIEQQKIFLWGKQRNKTTESFESWEFELIVGRGRKSH